MAYFQVVLTGPNLDGVDQIQQLYANLDWVAGNLPVILKDKLGVVLNSAIIEYSLTGNDI